MKTSCPKCSSLPRITTRYGIKYFLKISPVFQGNVLMRGFNCIGIGGRRENDTRTASHKKCGQTRSKAAFRRESGHAHVYKHCSMSGCYVGYSCVQIIISQICNILLKKYTSFQNNCVHDLYPKIVQIIHILLYYLSPIFIAYLLAKKQNACKFMFFFLLKMDL